MQTSQQTTLPLPPRLLDQVDDTIRRSGRQTRYHGHKKTLQCAVQAAARQARITKPVIAIAFAIPSQPTF